MRHLDFCSVYKQRKLSVDDSGGIHHVCHAGSNRADERGSCCVTRGTLTWTSVSQGIYKLHDTFVFARTHLHSGPVFENFF